MSSVHAQIADSQQQAFQNWKHSKAVKEGKGARVIAGASRRQVEVAEGDLKRGFLTSGLWSYSRHPVSPCLHRIPIDGLVSVLIEVSSELPA